LDSPLTILLYLVSKRIYNGSDNEMQIVYLLRTEDRAKAVPTLLAQFNLLGFKGKRIALKANYNSADPFPGSTHLETLAAIVKELKSAGAADIALAERSGMGLTSEVLAKMGVLKLSEQLGFTVVALDGTEEELWTRFSPSPGLHWENGFWVARICKKADKVVQTCCLKTHRFGGHFTLSLKNSIGLIARYGPKDGYNYMGALHSSPHQRLMIAEANLAYNPDIIVMDGIEAFVKGGPEDGDRVNPQVMLASQDRVAIDAVGVAILRHFGTTHEVSEGKIFEQQQIARAAELGLGVRSANDIKLVPLDAESKGFSDEIDAILAKG